MLVTMEVHATNSSTANEGASAPSLRMLWINGTPGRTPDALARAFSEHCSVHEIPLSGFRYDTQQTGWDAICFDFDKPSHANLTRVAHARNRWPLAAIILITRTCSTELALWALRLGLFDLLTKPATPVEVQQCVRRIREARSNRTAQPVPRAHLRESTVPERAAVTPPASAGDRLQRAKEYIALNYSRPLPETEVASICEMSPSWFCREFKDAFGTNYLEYLTQHRISHAQQLLREGAGSIAAVSAAVGFTDPSYFTRVFRRIVGVAPTQYRG